MNERKIFSICFLLALFIYSGLSINNTYTSLLWDLTHQEEMDESEETTGDILDTVKNDISIAESDISKHIYARYDCIEAYGQINRMLGKKEINGFDYALDKSNSYEPINFWSTAKDIPLRTYAQQVVMLRDAVEEKGGHFTFLMFPHKMNEAWNTGYEGIPYNDFNEQADRFLHWLDFYGVDYIDFRETLKKSGLEYNEMFYRTDHHWTGQAAFKCFQDLVGYMNNEYDANLDQTGYYRDESNYSLEWLKDCYLGSGGADVGVKYSGMGLEDFMLFTPMFKTNYSWTNTFDDKTRDSLFYEDCLTYENVYKSDMYRYYLLAINYRDDIKNLDNPNGPRAFFIRDSFASPLIADMAPLFSEIGASWGKYSSDRYIKDDVVSGDYDYVFVAYYPEDLIEEFFKFYSEDVEQFKLEYAKSQGYMKEEE